MPNTFEAVSPSGHERSSAFLSVPQPNDVLEDYMERSQLHRGSLREQDGYTIPFRDGGQVRITVREEGDDAEQGVGLLFEVEAPNTERRDYIEREVDQELGADTDGLSWQREQG
ncbi:hypothetical protein SGUI_0378 [Serinicoccus hydrothermalis]|uniref:Uncharacterized protein n=1 Tax=Serinicoccus hydrothermalis TaxID=1758689 RepID=A0A1B1N8N6_9MICO|nr:hypothetical protein [Serinicoccus hydrothermalis]ANS77774.1 hypothetical protein SGUI_0378 [Serinicoccus hydrothermalis]